GSGKEAILIVKQQMVQVLPVASVHTIQDQALLGLRQAVDLVNNFYRELGEVAPHHPLLAEVELAEIRPAHDLLFGLLWMPSNFAPPQHPQRDTVEESTSILGGSGFPQPWLANNELDRKSTRLNSSH